MPTYWKQGTEPIAPKNETATCDEPCTPTEGELDIDQTTFDTERDAQVAFFAFAQTFIDKAVPKLWDLLFARFKCTNKDCSKQEHCDADPLYVEVGSREVVVPDPSVPLGNTVKWRFYIKMARNIKCVKDDDKPPQDIRPKIPKFAPPPHPQPKK